MARRRPYFRRRRKMRGPKRGYQMGGRTSCPPGQHMMPDGTCMQGAYHGAPGSSGYRMGGGIPRNGGNSVSTRPMLRHCMDNSTTPPMATGTCMVGCDGPFCGYGSEGQSLLSTKNGLGLDWKRRHRPRRKMRPRRRGMGHGGRVGMGHPNDPNVQNAKMPGGGARGLNVNTNREFDLTGAICCVTQPYSTCCQKAMYEARGGTW